MEDSDDEEMPDARDDDEIDDSKAIVEATLVDYQKITLPRRRLGRWCNEPFFEKAIKDCFVKLFIGENEQGKR